MCSVCSVGSVVLRVSPRKGHLEGRYHLFPARGPFGVAWTSARSEGAGWCLCGACWCEGCGGVYVVCFCASVFVRAPFWAVLSLLVGGCGRCSCVAMVVCVTCLWVCWSSSVGIGVEWCEVRAVFRGDFLASSGLSSSVYPVRRVWACAGVRLSCAGPLVFGAVHSPFFPPVKVPVACS